MAQSIEPQIADLANGWLKQYKLKYFIEHAEREPESRCRIQCQSCNGI